MDKLYSPAELYKSGVSMVLGGTEPQTPEDWTKLVHFWAYNINPEMVHESVGMLCLIYRSPVEEDDIKKIATYYKDLALKRQEEALKQIIGKPVTHSHLKHLRSIMASNLQYADLVKVFDKAGINHAWPNHESWESWGKLCDALFLMKGAAYKVPQKEMAKIINEGAE
jgi:uncharacterized protein YcgL (UPF0745 family)